MASELLLHFNLQEYQTSPDPLVNVRRPSWNEHVNTFFYSVTIILFISLL